MKIEGRNITTISFLLTLIVFIPFLFLPSRSTAEQAFKDPYNGGVRLAQGGGEPGKAYAAFIDAIYKKDYSQICKLITDPENFDECLKQKEALNFYIQLFGQPQSHKVLGGYIKDDEATLNVAYTWPNMTQSTGFVVMKRINGKWIVSSTGGSGSAEIDAQASGKGELDSQAETGYFGPIVMGAGRLQYAGKCPVDVIFTSEINFKQPLPKDFSFKYHWERSDGGKTKERVATPKPGEAAMSLKENWKIGGPGEEYDLYMTLVIDSGGTHISKDSPVIKVTCE